MERRTARPTRCWWCRRVVHDKASVPRACGRSSRRAARTRAPRGSTITCTGAAVYVPVRQPADDAMKEPRSVPAHVGLSRRPRRRRQGLEQLSAERARGRHASIRTTARPATSRGRTAPAPAARRPSRSQLPRIANHRRYGNSQDVPGPDRRGKARTHRPASVREPHRHRHSDGGGQGLLEWSACADGGPSRCASWHETSMSSRCGLASHRVTSRRWRAGSRAATLLVAIHF